MAFFLHCGEKLLPGAERCFAMWGGRVRMAGAAKKGGAAAVPAEDAGYMRF